MVLKKNDAKKMLKSIKNLHASLLFPAIELRMVNAENGNKKWGRLEILYQEVWGHICDRTWTDQAADVACRQLKYKGGIAYGTYNTPSKVAWISSLNCTGKESRIENCPTGSRKLWEPNFGCTAASVLCYDKSGIIFCKGKVELY